MTFPPDEPTGGAAPADAAGDLPAPLPRTPTPAERLLARADALAAGPRPTDAVPVYRELLAADPAHMDARVHLARLLVQLDEHEEALNLLGEALRNAPDLTELLVLRGGIFGHLRRYGEADDDLFRVPLRRDRPGERLAHGFLARTRKPVPRPLR